jgi:hypothetical protein
LTANIDTGASFDALRKAIANMDRDAAAEAFDFYETLPPEQQQKFGNWTAKELLAFRTLIEDGLE